MECVNARKAASKPVNVVYVRVCVCRSREERRRIPGGYVGIYGGPHVPCGIRLVAVTAVLSRAAS